MSTPARILRATADSHHQRPELSPRQLACEERILAVSQTVMAVHGRDTITFTTMALALRMVRSTLRHYFCDLDVLLSEILRRHLRRLAYAIGDVPITAPDRPRQMRAAYLAATRTSNGSLTEAHLLLTRDRHFLPADLLPTIEALRHDLGDILAYGHAAEALALLDAPELDAPAIEAHLTAIAAPTPAAPEPAEPPAAAAPIAPAPPKIPTAAQQALASSWPELLEAFTPPPPDPTDDLYRVGRGFRAHPHPP